MAQSHRAIQLGRCLAKPEQRFRHWLRHLGSQDCLRSVSPDLLLTRCSASSEQPAAVFQHQRRQQHRPQHQLQRSLSLLLRLHGNADTECYVNSDGYSYGDADGYTDDYAKAHANAKARTDAEASSITAAETVSGSLPLNDGRLLHGRNSGRRTQFV